MTVAVGVASFVDIGAAAAEAAAVVVAVFVDVAVAAATGLDVAVAACCCHCYWNFCCLPLLSLSGRGCVVVFGIALLAVALAFLSVLPLLHDVAAAGGALCRCCCRRRSQRCMHWCCS